MASLADTLVKGGVGAFGFLASAYTLTKFIVATPVRVRPRVEGEHDMDVVLCFDAKTHGSEAAVEFFVRMVREQSQLVIRPKPKNVLEKHEEESLALKGERATAHPDAVYYLVGGSRESLAAIKDKKEKALHGEAPRDLERHVFNSGERIDLIMYELGRLTINPAVDANKAIRAVGTDASRTSEHVEEDEDTPDDSVTLVKAPEPFEDEESGLLLQQALHSRFVKEWFPLHDDKERHELVETWVKQWNKEQPLNRVRSYFGDEIGFYFAFLGMYTQWLVVLAGLGILVYLVEFLSDHGAYSRGLYSLFVTSWATAFLKFWKRRESSLRNEWGISHADSLALEPARPDFWGERRFDNVEGCYYTYFPSIERAKRYVVTALVTLAVLGVLVQFMFVYFWIEEWFVHKFTPEKGWEGLFSYVTLVPSVAYSVVVLLLDAKYSQLASYLTQFENHRTDSEFANAQVLKLVSFYFVNNFGSLFYLAFRARDMELLEQTLSSLLITRQLIGNLQEQLIPYMSARSSLKAEAGKLAKETNDTNASVDKIDAELLFPMYEGTFDDYLELFVQFGQVTLFASAYPLAALWSLANNVMEIRSDGFKLCVSFRRSRRVSTDGIGTWLYAFNALGCMSVMTNCAIFGLHSGLLNKLFPRMSFAGTLVAIGVMEHVMVAVKVAIEIMIPDMPSVVVEAHRMRRALLRKKASLQVELSTRRLIGASADTDQSDGQETTESSAMDVQVCSSCEPVVKEWLEKERERQSKLEREVKSLDDLYMGWIRDEQAKRKRTQQKLVALKQRFGAPSSFTSTVSGVST